MYTSLYVCTSHSLTCMESWHHDSSPESDYKQICSPLLTNCILHTPSIFQSSFTQFHSWGLWYWLNLALASKQWWQARYKNFGFQIWQNNDGSGNGNKSIWSNFSSIDLASAAMIMVPGYSLNGYIMIQQVQPQQLQFHSYKSSLWPQWLQFGYTSLAFKSPWWLQLHSYRSTVQWFSNLAIQWSNI